MLLLKASFEGLDVRSAYHTGDLARCDAVLERHTHEWPNECRKYIQHGFFC
jgi:hypothetical protein